jgi:hypothetical protein
VFLSDGSPKTLKKQRFEKTSCRRVLQNIRPKPQNFAKTDLFPICFYHVFGRFSVLGEGS